MHYQIWAPEGSTLEGLGLADLARDSQPSHVPSRGPGEGPGVLYAWEVFSEGGRASELTYLPERQLWRPSPPTPDPSPLPAGRYWFGVDKENPPTPADLARADFHGGRLLELGDGREWAIPCARKLPHRWGKNFATGAVGRFPLPAFEEFCARAAEIYALYVKPDRTGDVTLSDCWWYAVKALALNYRVNEDIVDWLGLVIDAVAMPLIWWTVELDIIQEVESEKKNTALAGIHAT